MYSNSVSSHLLHPATGWLPVFLPLQKPVPDSLGYFEFAPSPYLPDQACKKFTEAHETSLLLLKIPFFLTHMIPSPLLFLPTLIKPLFKPFTHILSSKQILLPQSLCGLFLTPSKRPSLTTLIQITTKHCHSLLFTVLATMTAYICLFFILPTER
jgi:hypothetical protein